MERKAVTERFKEIIKREENDIHNIYTPIELCNEMLDKLPELNSEINILVMFNLEFVYAIKERIGDLKNVWLYTGGDLKAKASIKWGVPENQVVKYEYNIKESLENMPKFDVVVGNPPYKKNLHLKFLDLSFNILNDKGKLVFVHPSTWLVLLRTGKTYDKYNELKTKFRKYITYINFNAGKYFDRIKPYVPLEIILIDKENIINDIKFIYNEQEQLIENIKDVNLIGSYNIITSIENKIINKNLKSIKYHIKKTHQNYFINLSWMVGTGYVSNIFYDGIERKYENRYNLINSTTNKITDTPMRALPRGGKSQGNLKSWISFSEKEEANNFLNFINKSKLCKYLIISYNIDQHIDAIYKYIPYLDWSKQWKDNDIYKYFEFNNEEITLIENTIEKFKISL